jgi:hypothetical protein
MLVDFIESVSGTALAAGLERVAESTGPVASAIPLTNENDHSSNSAFANRKQRKCETHQHVGP